MNNLYLKRHKKVTRNKKFSLILILGIFLMVISSVQDVSAVGEISHCCEKTVEGAWCQNAPVEKCDQDYKNVPTSCEATSYCKLGTCVDSQEGTCMPNSPERVCNDEGGVWEMESSEELGQCQLGCCLMGDQAAFVTQTRCKRLSAVYGLETNYRTDIQSEVECIASATSDVKGACVFERDYEKTCQFVTKKECQEMGAKGGQTSQEKIDTKSISGKAILEGNNKVEFHEGFLCSDESLGTNCGPSKKTTCIEGRDEVYFLDTCGNLANIYDASKIKSKNYWSKIYDKSESCGAGLSNADSSTCGSCDYYLGSTCKLFKRGEDRVKPNYGDNICRDLSCEYNGKEYQHGETWCASSEGTKEIFVEEETVLGFENVLNENLPGSRYFRAVCYNGDVTIEPCADFRQEICLESEVNGFKTAACRVNQWQDCTSQNSSLECENPDKRDCVWIDTSSREGCVPKYTPGFNFWAEESEASSICSLASAQCTVTYEKDFGGSKKCIDNCECLDGSAKMGMEAACMSLGDCGNKVNYIGVEGYGFGEKTKFDTKKVKEKDDSGGLF